MAAYVSGSSGSGSLTQLIAQGALDAYLSQNATFTFWKVRYNKHTNFAMEGMSQPFHTAVSWGAESHMTLNRNGDLVYHCYLVIDLPGLIAVDTSKEACAGAVSGQFPSVMNESCAPCAKNDESVVAEYIEPGDNFTDASSTTKEALLATAKQRYMRAHYGQAPIEGECCDEVDDCPSKVCEELAGTYAYWTNDIGQFACRCARIVIGGSTIDTLYNDFLFCWEELSGKSGRRLTEMVGKRYSRASLICDSRQRRTLWVPLPFWFASHSGCALALSSLQFHGVQLMVEFERLERAIVVSGPHVAVKNASTGCCLTPNDLSAAVEMTYVFLEQAERERFATTQYETLIIQHQAYHCQTTGSQVRMNLSFNHPCLEILWFVRRKCQELCNNWFNYSGQMGLDPVVSASLFLNNQARFANKSGAYLRLVQPYQHHSNVPDVFLYVYSFALFPEDASPSGSCNFSRIDHVDLHLVLQDGLSRETTSVVVFARSWNILRFREGLAGLAFAN